VIRTFDESGAKAFLAVYESGKLQDLVERRQVVGFEIISEQPLRLRSPLVPFVSYPDEWTPQMLRDAGLLTLAVAKDLWNAGFHLRDASAYNIVFDGPKPVFVDLGSVGIGHTPTWHAYGQFCDHFLAPLMIEAHIGSPYKSFWSLEGVPLAVAAPLFRGSARFRRGVATNIILRSKLEGSHSDDSLEERKRTRKEFALSPQSILGLMEKMESLLVSLDFSITSTWGEYEETNSYKEDQQSRRDSTIADFASATEAKNLAVDIGANAGRHSATLSEKFGTVVAVDIDDVATELHRQRLHEKPATGKVFVVVADLSAPTPSQGFLLNERSSLIERLSGADAAIWMAVIHHLVIGKSVPFSAVAELARAIAPRHLIEFVDPDDPMVQLLSASKGGEHHEYTKSAFVEAFSRLFTLNEISSSTPTRSLFEAVI
jgi:hypothetical protein